MPFTSLSGTTGYLAVGATPVRLTANLNTATKPYLAAAGAKLSCHTIYIQQHESNTSKLYLLDRVDGNPTTGVGVLATMIAPFTVAGDLTGLAFVSVTIPYAPGGLNGSDYWLVADAADQKATVSALLA